MTQLSKGVISCLTDRMDSIVLPKWAELKIKIISVHLLLLAAVVLELVKLLEYCLYVLPIDEVRDLDPSRNVLVSFICLNDFIA